MATLYLVLRESEELGSTRLVYEPTAKLEAASAVAAVRATVERRGELGETQAGVYVAVPARSWTPQAVAVEQKPRVVLSEPPTRPKLAPAEQKAETA